VLGGAALTDAAATTGAAGAATTGAMAATCG
jgi:hypothetical protein